jgi:hypothetical protein
MAEHEVINTTTIRDIIEHILTNSDLKDTRILSCVMNICEKLMVIIEHTILTRHPCLYLRLSQRSTRVYLGLWAKVEQGRVQLHQQQE